MLIRGLFAIYVIIHIINSKSLKKLKFESLWFTSTDNKLLKLAPETHSFENIQVGASCETNQRLLAVKYFSKTHNLRCPREL